MGWGLRLQGRLFFWVYCAGVLVFCVNPAICSTLSAAANPLKLSPNGRFLLISDFYSSQFMVLDTNTEKSFAVQGTLTGGMEAAWSADSNRIGFKIICESTNLNRMQAPAILDVTSAACFLLNEFIPLSGSPSFSHNGSVAFTADRQIIVKNTNFDTLDSIPIPDYCNWTALSPDGNHLVYNDRNDRLYLYDRNEKTNRPMTPESGAFCRPVWSPDGNYILLSSITGDVYSYCLTDDSLVFLGLYHYPVWYADSLHILASEPIQENDRMMGRRLVQLDLSGQSTIVLEDSAIHPVFPCVNSDGTLVYFQDAVSGTLYKGIVDNNTIQSIFEIQIPTPSSCLTVPQSVRFTPVKPFSNERSILYIRGIPYLHQVHCTPAAFNGHWACNATAAMMAISYYSLLPHWDFTATSPFSHTSHYGNYVSEIYTYNGHTYNIESPDPSGDPAYGGYGYIVQNDWEETREHMKEYISYHGLSSPYVDWSPTWSELQTEINNRTPMVLLSLITSSGHYTTVAGYHEGWHTAYFNDPYGNKNQGYMNFNGAGVSYDWPGYGNGYVNLEYVSCFIYARGTPPLIEPGTIDDPILITGFPYTDANTTCSSGGDDLFNAYSCASSVDESGREKIYRFSTDEPGTLSVSVSCNGAVDIDIHLLASPDAGDCLRRADISFSQHIDSGTYYISCDTYVTGSLVELMGDYTLNCSFIPDVTSTPTPSPSPTASSTASSSPTPALTVTQTPEPSVTQTPAPVPAEKSTGILASLVLISLALSTRKVR